MHDREAPLKFHVGMLFKLFSYSVYNQFFVEFKAASIT